MTFSFEVIVPDKPIFDVKDFNRRAIKALNRTNTTIETDFEKTTRTWNNKPAFQQRKATLAKPEAETSTNDKVYFFLTRGTRVRYATMMPGFQAKTSPRVIGSSRGRGGVLFVNKRKPRPGIKARNFDDEIAKRRSKTLEGRLNKAVKDSTPL